MALSFLLGAALVITTTVVHTGGMIGLIRVFRLAHVERWDRQSPLARVTVVGSVALVMGLASMVEAGLWAATYLALGAISGVEQAMYFSTVTYTTLGFGDVVLTTPWRLLSAIQAANGTIMFGWTTALLFATVHRVYFDKASDRRFR